MLWNELILERLGYDECLKHGARGLAESRSEGVVDVVPRPFVHLSRREYLQEALLQRRASCVSLFLSLSLSLSYSLSLTLTLPLSLSLSLFLSLPISLFLSLSLSLSLSFTHPLNHSLIHPPHVQQGQEDVDEEEVQVDVIPYSLGGRGGWPPEYLSVSLSVSLSLSLSLSRSPSLPTAIQALLFFLYAISNESQNSMHEW